MLLQASNLFRMPVASMDDNAKVGVVRTVLVDKKVLVVSGFLIRTGNFLFGKNLLLSCVDILDIDRNGIVVKNSKNLVDPNEVVRIKEMLDEKFNLFGMRARTKTKKNLGKISDFVVETTTLQIVKFYIHGILEDRIIDISKVKKVSDKEIIFDDDIEMPTVSATEQASV